MGTSFENLILRICVPPGIEHELLSSEFSRKRSIQLIQFFERGKRNPIFYDYEHSDAFSFPNIPRIKIISPLTYFPENI